MSELPTTPADIDHVEPYVPPSKIVQDAVIEHDCLRKLLDNWLQDVCSADTAIPCPVVKAPSVSFSESRPPAYGIWSQKHRSWLVHDGIVFCTPSSGHAKAVIAYRTQVTEPIDNPDLIVRAFGDDGEPVPYSSALPSEE